MDLEKIDLLHVALSATALTESTEEEMTSAEVLAAVMRMFAHVVAAHVYKGAAALPVMRHEIETHCDEAKHMALARLHTIRVYDGDPAGPQSSGETSPDPGPV
jgi:hypothetical protein